ncbi:hypothetical protein A3F55_03145 [Candidatus Adlerbacteria bacterium RIFCSPHIGHO2_12_FULL_53_18]|uniref:Uncharacterized protein n=1 Tax=Candidatus Adlerbacteria bacterium RIFCSPHIGHO2_12_FULL_53_18 TaxID=1797242 RepID=A0A1F4XST6_9BACT|nr:MAG: hypothetical protein A3F55_03145 [Candidatus Adlerbacteria bacterium RIFCSPHIGHO2_12_FULL_53_18]
MDIPLTTPKLIPATQGQIRQLGGLFEKVAAETPLHRPAVQMAMRQSRFKELEEGISNLLLKVARPFEEVGEPFERDINWAPSLAELRSFCALHIGKIEGEIFPQFREHSGTLWTRKYQILELLTPVPIEYLGDGTYVHGTLQASGYDHTGVREIMTLAASGFDFRKAMGGRSVNSVVIVGTGTSLSNPILNGDSLVPGVECSFDKYDESFREVRFTHFSWAATHPHEYRILVRLRK